MPLQADSQPSYSAIQSRYRGRFAPSPTGQLHLGSLVAALASYLVAKANGGSWLIRMEDLDPPREQAGAAAAILHTLEVHGLHSDLPVLWQSQRQQQYQQALDQLLDRDQAFVCQCSRSELARWGGYHRGRCRSDRSGPAAIRLGVDNTVIRFEDAIQGLYCQTLEDPGGAFVLRRKDGLFAYQLAVVVDDAEQDFSHIIRGSDLLDSTPRQIFLQQRLGLPQISYGHIPVVSNSRGQKLSKQNHAQALCHRRPEDNIALALAFLRQPLPADPLAGTVDELLAWAAAHWRPALIPNQHSATEPAQ
jgi:glutamyl-Q tRNA(Asp) synthetase